MSNWNALSVEAALQQLNTHDEDGEVRSMRRPNTVRIEFLFNNDHQSKEKKKIIIISL